MTKRKANAGPKGFQPGNQAAVKEVTRVKTHFTLDPDQLAWLRNQPEGISPTVRKAIDLYRNLSEEDNTMAKIIIHYEDQHGNSQERTTRGEVVSTPRINGNQVEATVSYEGEQAQAERQIAGNQWDKPKDIYTQTELANLTVVSATEAKRTYKVDINAPEW